MTTFVAKQNMFSDYMTPLMSSRLLVKEGHRRAGRALGNGTSGTSLQHILSLEEGSIIFSKQGSEGM